MVSGGYIVTKLVLGFVQMREVYLNDASNGFVAEWLIASLRFLSKQDVDKVFLPLSGVLSYVPCSALLEIQELLQERVEVGFHLLHVGHVARGMEDPLEPWHEIAHHIAGADCAQGLLNDLLEPLGLHLSFRAHPKDSAKHRN